MPNARSAGARRPAPPLRLAFLIDGPGPLQEKHFVLPTPSISIVCESKDERYRLQFPDVDFAETFGSEEEAVRRACELVVEETTLTIFAKDGSRLVVAVIYPNSGL
jgi:hypothetical protein